MQTPIEFEVAEALFDEETHCLLIGGLVPAGARVAPGMKVSVAVDPTFALELGISRVEQVGSRRGSVGIAVWIEAASEAERSLFRVLGIGNERLLVWAAGDRVDVDRHFVYGETYAEVTLSLRPPRRCEQTH